MPISWRTVRTGILLTGILQTGLLATSCDPPVQEEVEEVTDPARDKFIRANQYMQQRHQDHISAFVQRLGWEAQVTPTGLWIILEEDGSGNPVRHDSRVTFAFESMLLDGTPAYHSTPERPKTITMGKGGVESGVEQGLLKLREGSSATLLIPPHLGHGNFGDRDKIPGNSVLIYHVQVLKVQ
jgi:FKBP-type peptidyl-prolyl cis-trans isomerase